MKIQEKLSNYSDGQRLKKAIFRYLDSVLSGIILTLLESIKTPLGQWLRWTTYQLIFCQVGKGTSLPQEIEFAGTRRIALGDNVNLNRFIRIRSLSTSSSIKIAHQVTLDKGVDIKAALGAIEIGHNTYIGPYTCLSGGEIKIGHHCLIASHSGIYANNHRFDNPNQFICDQSSSFEGITIEDNCWIGSGVRIVDGVTIGQGSVIGAGAVVTKAG